MCAYVIIAAINFLLLICDSMADVILDLQPVQADESGSGSCDRSYSSKKGHFPLHDSPEIPALVWLAF